MIHWTVDSFGRLFLYRYHATMDGKRRVRSYAALFGEFNAAVAGKAKGYLTRKRFRKRGHMAAEVYTWPPFCSTRAALLPKNRLFSSFFLTTLCPVHPYRYILSDVSSIRANNQIIITVGLGKSATRCSL